MNNMQVREYILFEHISTLIERPDNQGVRSGADEERPLLHSGGRSK